MPYCKECGKEIGGPTGSVCPNCQQKLKKNKKNRKKRIRGKWYNLARGINYPITFFFIIMVIVDRLLLEKYILPVFGFSMPTDWWWDLIRAGILIIIGLVAVDKEGPSIIATVGFLVVCIPLILGIAALVWFVIELLQITT